MKIKISNTEAIQAMLDDVQAKARVRTITPTIIADTCERVADELRIPKSAMKGVTFTADYHARTFPNAYKGSPESTHFTAEFNGKEWIVTSIFRNWVRRPTLAITVNLTDTAKDAIIRRCTNLPV